MNRHSQMILHGILSQQRKDKAFVTVWDIPYDGYELPWPTAALSGHSFDYNIDWGDGSPTENITSPLGVSHVFANAGIHKVKAKGVIPNWRIADGEMKYYLLGVDNWGDVGFQYFEEMFYGCENLEAIYGDVVLFGSCAGFFKNCYNFNSEINHWDMGGVTSLENFFLTSYGRNPIFNQDIGRWNVSNVTNMRYMFYNASSFNQDIGEWDVSKVRSMQSMFYYNSVFNQDIGGWDVGNVTNMISMIRNCNSFNQDLSGWCVEKIKEEPAGFGSTCGAWVLPRPNWGTCPNND